MPVDYLPSREAELIQWSRNFDSFITADPPAYGLDAAQAAAYNTLHLAFEAALQAAANSATRTHPVILAKNDAKEALIAEARRLVNIIQAFPGTTNQERGDLQITVRDTEPTPVPIPGDAPTIELLSVKGRTLQVRLRDVQNPDRRGKPDGVDGASVFYYVGEEVPPSEPDQWKFFGSTTRTLIDIECPTSVPPGSKVWVTAFWYNSKAQSGPASPAVSTRFADVLSPPPGGLKKAA